jgi:predicted RNA-binding protein with PUA-like domain
MAFWLIKSEPSAWSWNEQVKAGAKGTAWSGVRNHLAKQNLIKMKKGEQCFFYHSNEGKEIVGVCEVIKEAYPDPIMRAGEPWVAVDVKATSALKKPVTLAEIKANAKLAGMALIKSARLSVQPVTADEWKLICKLGGV